jgi:hypothetical protein
MIRMLWKISWWLWSFLKGHHMTITVRIYFGRYPWSTLNSFIGRKTVKIPFCYFPVPVKEFSEECSALKTLPSSWQSIQRIRPTQKRYNGPWLTCLHPAKRLSHIDECEHISLVILRSKYEMFFHNLQFNSSRSRQLPSWSNKCRSFSAKQLEKVTWDIGQQIMLISDRAH